MIKYLAFEFLGLGILVDAFLFSRTHEWFMLFLLIIWVALLITKGYESTVSFRLFFLGLLLSIIFLLFKMEVVAEKLSSWVYLFLIVGTIQEAVRYVRHRRS